MIEIGVQRRAAAGFLAFAVTNTGRLKGGGANGEFGGVVTSHGD
jgi:hypothetical protein